MKVCQVLASTGEGGLENHVATLANSLADGHGLDSVVIAPPAFAGKLAAAVRFIPLDLTGGRHNPLLLWKLLQALRECRPDIIHAHASKAAAMVGAVRRFSPARCVATVHGTKRRTGVYRRFDRVIAVSRALAETISGAPVTVIHNGVPKAVGLPACDGALLRRELGIAAQRPLVAAVGRLAPVKGFDLLLRAWQGVDAELLLVGDGPERERLQEDARRLGLAGRAHFLGFRSDVAALLRVCDLMVISSHREGFPLVLVEALQARVPVVSTDVSGVRELLPGEMLVPVGDAEALAEGIRRFFALGRERAAALFEDAFRYAGEELTLERAVAKTAELYREVAGAAS